MADNRITLRLTNAEIEDAPILVRDLLDGLRAARRVLRATQREVAPGIGPLEWRVLKLSSNSPATITVEPMPEPGYAEVSALVVRTVFDFANRIQAGEYAGLSSRVLNSFRALAAPVESGRVAVELLNGVRTFSVPLGMEPKIEAMLSPETTALGSVKGRLEFINIHGRTNVFRVYPTVGPSYVECRFSPAMIDEAKRAIGRSVLVYGKLHYKEVDRFAYRVDVRDIEILPLDSDLPSIMDIRGIATRLTGSESSEDFVKSVRRAAKG